jgi:hypothetical protein
MTLLIFLLWTPLQFPALMAIKTCLQSGIVAYVSP